MPSKWIVESDKKFDKILSQNVLWNCFDRDTDADSYQNEDE